MISTEQPTATAANLVDLFALGGPAKVLAQSSPLLLNGSADAWLVSAGMVDVFALRLHEGRPAGPLRHLFRVQSGQLILGLGNAEQNPAVVLLARGHPDTSIQRSSLRDLLISSTAPTLADQLAPLLDGWIDALSADMAPGPAPTQHIPLVPEQDALLNDREVARPASGVLWVQHVEGKSRYMGRQDLPNIDGQAALPVSANGWLEADGPCQLRSMPTAALLAQPDLPAALEFFHRLVLAGLHANILRDEAAERSRIERQTVRDRRVVGQAVEELSNVLLAEADDDSTAPADSGDPLYTACRVVGERMGLIFKPPRNLPAALQHRDPVFNLARSSGIRARQVALRGEWWSKDGGPLVGLFEKEDGSADHARPVALLPLPGARYEAYDVVAGMRTPVTAQVADTISAFAYTFRRPLPERAAQVRELLAFGLRDSQRDLGLVLLMGLLTGLLGITVPLATGFIFDNIIPTGNRDQLLGLAVLLLAAALAVAGFSLVRGIAMLRVETRASNAIQVGLWDRLLRLPVPFFRAYSVGELANRALSIDRMRQVLTDTTIPALLALIFVFVNLGLLFYLDAGLALVALLLVLLAAGVTLLTGYFQLRAERRLVPLQGHITGMVLQLITGITKLRVSGTEPRAFALWADQFADQRRLAFQARSIANRLTVFNAAFPIISLLVIFAAAGLSGNTARSTGAFLAFLAAFGAMLAATLEASTGLLALLRVVPMFESALPILTARPEVDAAKLDPGELSGRIEVSHVSFAYSPGGANILHDISISAKPGEFIALVGPSGSGKSTLMRLLLGFESPSSGSVYYDGKDLAQLNVPAVRRQIGVVLQSERPMPGDIYTNIVGTSLLTPDDAWAALRGAGLEEDVRHMPMGLYTIVGEGGSTFSGGQRQRLMIARAIVSKPRILIFDEATSALDNQTQAQVSKSLETLRATRIVIAHRLSTIIRADRIYVIVGGRVVQSGSYQELIGQPGPFADLAKRQLA